MSRVQKIIAQLPQLTDQERRTLRAALDFLSARKGSGKHTPRSTDDWILPGIEADLRRRGLSADGLTVARATKLAPAYSDEAVAVCALLEKRLRKGMPEARHAHFLALGIIAARALSEHLPNRLPPGVPVGVRAMLQNVSFVPEALDESYPDYISAGTLGMLLKTSTSGSGKR